MIPSDSAIVERQRREWRPQQAQPEPPLTADERAAVVKELCAGLAEPTQRLERLNRQWDKLQAWHEALEPLNEKEVNPSDDKAILRLLCRREAERLAGPFERSLRTQRSLLVSEVGHSVERLVKSAVALDDETAQVIERARAASARCS